MYDKCASQKCEYFSIQSTICPRSPLDMLQVVPVVNFDSTSIIICYGCSQRKGDVVLG